MKQLRGCGTALVTPLTQDNKVDQVALRYLVNWQIANGVNFLVPVGTTGECATLSEDEHLLVIRIVVEESAGRVPVVAGTGSNNLAEALRLTEGAKALGADACLVVTPYYNRPTFEGVLAYYTALNDVGLPMVVYNVPHRTGLNLLPDQMATIACLSNMVGVKDACGNMAQTIATMQAVEAVKCVEYFCGDDQLIFPMMALGASGVISVASNIVPHTMQQMCVMSGNDGLASDGRAKFFELFPLFQALGLTTNPIMVKEALAMMGMIDPVLRMPLTRDTQNNRNLLREEMIKLRLISRDLKI